MCIFPLQYVNLRTHYSELATLTNQYIRFITETRHRLDDEEVSLTLCNQQDSGAFNSALPKVFQNAQKNLIMELSLLSPSFNVSPDHYHKFHSSFHLLCPDEDDHVQQQGPALTTIFRAPQTLRDVGRVVSPKHIKGVSESSSEHGGVTTVPLRVRVRCVPPCLHIYCYTIFEATLFTRRLLYPLADCYVYSAE